jgi:2,3-diaminopropionate biosynthesis protein SbnB
VPSAPTFYVIPGSAAKRAVESHRKDVFDAVEAAYRLHASGNTVNPDSYFLRYPDKPSARIIALPAHLGGAVQISGIKWISSFPENRASNLARASAVLILNDATTGYPVACIEASLISATRTGASAALAAEHMSLNPFEGTLGIVGTGVIARTTVEWLLFRNWKFRKISLYDADRKEAEHFSKWLREQHSLRADIQDRLEGALSDASLVLFATTALEPYLANETLLKHAPAVIHLSLRDICVNVILASQNVVDDVDHCLKAGTLSQGLWSTSWRRSSSSITTGLASFRPSVLAFLMLRSAILFLRPQRRPARQWRFTTSSAIPPDGEKDLRVFESINARFERERSSQNVVRSTIGLIILLGAVGRHVTDVKGVELQ